MNGSDRRDRREAFIVFALLKAQDYTISILRRDDGFHADGIVDEFEEVRPLRRIDVVHEQPRGDLAPVEIEHMAASTQPMRRPHAIIFRPFRSSPKSSTMHFMRTSPLPMYSPLSSRRMGRCSGVSSWLAPQRCSCSRSSSGTSADRCCIRRCPWT